MKRIIWGCDVCGKKAEEYVIPSGWLECSFQNNEKWHRYCFCSYACLTIWSEKREQHYQHQFAKEQYNEVNCHAKPQA